MTADRWQQALLARDLLAIDPEGLRGLTLRARMGPVRQAYQDALRGFPLPLRRLHPDIGDDQLFGGVNVSDTLAQGRVVRDRGLLQDPCAAVLTMAERCPPDLAAKLAQGLDSGTVSALILLDEGTEDEAAPPALTERLAFHIDLDRIGRLEARPAPLPDLGAARARLPQVTIDPEAISTLTALAARFGIDSLRAPLLALRAARAHAALLGQDSVTSDDLRIAAELVFPARATRMPDPEPEADETPPDPPEAQPKEQDSDQGSGGDEIPDEMLIEAVQALLPPNLIDTAGDATPSKGARGSGAGARRKGNRRGRPLPPRPGRLDGRRRIDLVATLRAAAPWQPLRRQQAQDERRLIIHPSDIRVKRYEDRSDRLLIFTVDASGSAALARLAEAKGAVEILLAEAYARRDHVALIAFRGEEAELLLPPTRSLVQTKRRLAALPGGGGTPLAAGLRAAGDLAQQARHHGLSPTAVLLTDGRANIALDGEANRDTARQDAEQLARLLRAEGIPGLVLDVSTRPQAPLADLAAQMGAPYVALPRADAQRLSRAVTGALEV